MAVTEVRGRLKRKLEQASFWRKEGAPKGSLKFSKTVPSTVRSTVLAIREHGVSSRGGHKKINQKIGLRLPGSCTFVCSAKECHVCRGLCWDWMVEKMPAYSLSGAGLCTAVFSCFAAGLVMGLARVSVGNTC